MIPLPAFLRIVQVMSFVVAAGASWNGAREWALGTFLLGLFCALYAHALEKR